ncbi:hypothetical protein EZV62_002999 [Acer yangbiense]|uniref:Uncharacterized protein n=1 Tax=Acer yangbiense TaxID=1000413 RepID=A0A5C7IYV6_9ROSI|nr:hypothetical protein EZV62_002999 [Acer yangbiense]
MGPKTIDDDPDIKAWPAHGTKSKKKGKKAIKQKNQLMLNPRMQRPMSLRKNESYSFGTSVHNTTAATAPPPPPLNPLTISWVYRIYFFGINSRFLSQTCLLMFQ